MNSELLKRVFTGQFIIALVLIVLFYFPSLFVIFIIFVMALALGEYHRALKNTIKIFPWLIYFIAAGLCIYALLEPSVFYNNWFIYLFSLHIIFLIIGLYGKHLKIKFLKNFTFIAIQNIWIVLPLTLYLLIYNQPNAKFYIMLIIFICTINDSVAYFIGKMYGKTPLAPKISPNKTREGALAGLVASVFVGVLVGYFFSVFELWESIILSIILAIGGQIGDLVESYFKRYCQIKDSGKLLPGHGGILDRIDSFLFASWFFFIYVFFKEFSFNIPFIN